MILEGRVGPVTAADGVPDAIRLDRTLAQVTSDGHGRYYETTYRGNAFTLSLAATTTGVAAGNIVAAAGAAVTQFALINPLNSGRYLVLLKFGMGVISGTPGAGPLFHGYIPGASSITAASPGGTIRSNVLGVAASSVAIPWALAAGSAITGGQAPVTHRIADFSSTNTTQASVGELKAIEEIAGDLIVPPGAAWLPLWGAAGTTLLNAYSISWEETPL